MFVCGILFIMINRPPPIGAFVERANIMTYDNNDGPVYSVLNGKTCGCLSYKCFPGGYVYLGTEPLDPPYEDYVATPVNWNCSYSWESKVGDSGDATPFDWQDNCDPGSTIITCFYTI
jgi:hypothetical protein